MEHIIKAVERAKGSSPANYAEQQQRSALAQVPRHPQQYAGGDDLGHSWGKEIKLNDTLLESHRIIAHNVADPRSRSFDMLRTPVLQTMGMKAWQLLGITSPTPSCGKTLVSINLALSIARQQERSVLLVDLDLRRPQVANCLGIKTREGLVSVLEGQSTLSDATVQAIIKDQKFLVLPAE